VDFDLSSDQEALVDAAAGLLESLAAVEQVRKAGDRPDRIDRALWAQMAEQGWLAVERREASGGLGMGFVEVAVLCEQIGRHLAPVPFAGTVLALHAIEAAAGEVVGDAAGEVVGDAAGEVVGDAAGASGDAAGSAELVERLATGDAMGAVAWTRRPGQVVAERSGGGSWSLTGRPDPVVFGPVADVVIVPAEIAGSPGERELFVVADLPESSRVPQPAMDLTRSLGWLELAATPATLLSAGAGSGADGDGDSDGAAGKGDGDGHAAGFASLADRAAVAVSAEMLGAAQRVLDMTVQYAKDRVQFGRPIGSFQAVKHRCADMLVDVEGMRSAVYYAAWCIAADSPDASSAASAAKIWCSEAASRVMASGLQVHGGIGFTWEHDMHLFVKRSQLDQVSFGDTSWHHDRLAAMLRSLAEAGLPVM
jgi:alkylation response protein AidB-like acyl-CoA dehydrogenase